MKKLSKETLILIISSVLITSGYVSGFLFIQWYQQPVHHFDQFRQPITIFLGAILAGILTVTIFYMGKFHDYQREFIKRKGQFEDSVEQLKISQDDFKETITNLQIRIKLIENKPYLEEINKKFGELNDAKRLDGIIKKTDEFKKTINEIVDDYKTFPKSMIKSLVIDVSPFLGGFVYMTSIILNPTLGKFYFLLIVLAVAINSFLQSWYTSERKMRSLHRFYEIVTDMMNTTNASKYQIDFMKSRSENLLDLILSREKIDSTKDK